MIRKINNEDIIAISSYFPYNLWVEERESGFHQQIIGIRFNGSIEYLNWNAPENHTINDVYLLLRPMSRLDIEIDGVNVLLEMAKLLPNRDENWHIENDDQHPFYYKKPYYISGNDKIYIDYYDNQLISYIEHNDMIHLGLTIEMIDLLNKYHFDYRYLIERGIAKPK